MDESKITVRCLSDSDRHRAATTGATPFIRLILSSESTGSFKKPRLNLQDRAGNTPLHLGEQCSDISHQNIS